MNLQNKKEAPIGVFDSGVGGLTVAREIKENRTKLQAAFPCGNDCKFFTNCHKRQMCGADIEACNKDCKRCRGFNCRESCDDYESAECMKTEKPPYVCNTCSYSHGIGCLCIAQS